MKNNTRAIVFFGLALSVVCFCAGGNVSLNLPTLPWSYALIASVFFLLGGISFWLLKKTSSEAPKEAKKPQEAPKASPAKSEPKAPATKPEAQAPKAYDQDHGKPQVFDFDNT